MSLDASFGALAEPTRRGVVEALRTGPLRAGELAAALGVRPPALTRHLRVLREAGLVQEEAPVDDGRARVYRLRAEPFSELERWAHELSGFWTEQLAAFAEHVGR